MKLTLFHKGLILLAIPIAALLAFLGLTFRTQREQAHAQLMAAHSKEVIAEAKHVLANVSDSHSGVLGYAITRDPTFEAPFHRAGQEIPEGLASLRALVADNPGQLARAEDLHAKATRLLEWQTKSLRELKEGAAERVLERGRAREGLDRLEEFTASLNDFLTEEERLDRERRDDLEEARQQVNHLLVWGTVAAGLLAGLLGMVFRRGISGRFTALMEDVRRLGAGEELGPPLAGVDEIAQLDRAFRSMAASLTRTAEELRESHERFQDLYDNSPCGYHSVDPEGTIVAMNTTELAWLGYTARQVLGRMKFVEMVSPGSRDLYSETFRSVKEQGSASNVELELVRVDGTVFPILLNSTAIRDPKGRYLRSRSTLTDLTERKRAEDAVRRMNEELEQRVRERTTELAETNRVLAERNEENELFVYSVSHDLRSPLVNLQGFSQELAATFGELRSLVDSDGIPPATRERAVALLDRDAAEALQFIKAGVMRLSGIIDALLRLSRAGRIEYQYRPTDVGAAVRRVVDSLRGTIAAKATRVVVGDLSPVWGDSAAIDQVFANLIGNALNYLDPARPGLIEVGQLAPQGGEAAVTFFVRDNGRGIPQAYQQKVFQAFQRFHPEASPGEGMGLAIVRRVVERHRGRIWVESQPGVGTTFFVQLPAKGGGSASGITPPPLPRTPR